MLYNNVLHPFEQKTLKFVVEKLAQSQKPL